MTSERPCLYLIVPVLNEAGNMPRLMAGVRELAAELADSWRLVFCLVDDGSTDDTGAIAGKLAEDLDFQLLRHESNGGPGMAFATGFAHVGTVVQPTDWVVTMEGDNTSRLETLKQMLVRSREGFDVVLASPHMYGGGFAETSWFRVLISQLSGAFVKACLGIRGINTVSSFFRLYSATTILRLQETYGSRIVERRGFESMVELLLKLTYLETSISEVALRLDTSVRVGRSKMRVMRTARGYFTLLRDLKRWRHAARLGQKAV
jgi:dolichol-phosphate mannosyltransferase